MSNSASSNNKKQETAPRGITTISVRGYKSLYDECRLEIRPLTILAGANSSGKSSAMQPLLLLKQTLEASYDPGPLLLNGPNVRFNSAEQLFSRLTEKNITDNFIIKLSADSELFLADTFEKHSKKGIELAEMEYSEGNSKGILRLEASHKKMDPLEDKALKDLYKTFSIKENEPLEIGIVRSRCFFGFELHYQGRSLGILNPSDAFNTHIRRIVHVPGLRGNPERTYKTSAIGSEFSGTFENYVASVINHWQITEDHRLKDLQSSLQTLGLTRKVEAKQVNDTQVELRVSRLPFGNGNGAKDMVSIADVGFGVSQILPVLVALLTAEPGQLVYLEQPEIHLHPRAQVALAKILADAANRGVRVVAETHSSLLLLGIQALVAEKRLAPEKVKLHWFKRRDDGATEITSADLDEAGAFGDWPEDFADVDLETESRYLDAAELRRGMR